jgi:PAS domain S-box-containing protein
MHEGFASMRVIRDQDGFMSDAEIQLVNRSLEQLIGFKKDILVGGRLSTLATAYPGMHIPLANRIDEAERDGKDITFDLYSNHHALLFRITLTSPSPQICYAFVDDITSRKAAEEKNLFNEMMIQSIFAAVHAPVFYKDLDRRYRYCNDAFSQYIGMPCDWIIGKTVWDVSPPDLAEKYEKADIELIQNESTQEYETLVRYADGNSRNVHFYKSFVRDGKGKGLGIVGVMLDITDLKRNEAELRKFKLAVEHSSASIVITDDKGNIEYINPKFTDMTGYSFDEVRGKNPRILKSGLVEDRVYRNLWDTISNGDEWKGEFFNKKKDGSLYWERALVSSLKNENGDITHFVGVKEDITEQKKNEVALRESTRTVNELLDALGGPALLFKPGGDIVSMNRVAARMLGVDRSESEGANIYELINEQDREYYIKFREQLYQERKAINVERTYGDTTFDIVIYPIFASDGTLFRVALYGHDITLLKKAGEALEQSVKNAVESNQGKSRFVAVMSHEIRSPIAAIISMAGIAETLSTEEKQEYFISIKRTAEHLHRIVDNILDFTRLEAKKMELSLRAFSIDHCVRDAVRLFGAMTKEKGISLKYNCDKSFPKLLIGDDDRINQVVVNLVGNAVKFTEKGSVTVSVINKGADESGRSHIRIKVCDTGPGIDNSRLEDIFDSFTQVDPDTSRNFGGSGLGLAIVKQLVELMGGRVNVDSRVGGGSCFSVDLFLEEGSDVPEKIDHSQYALAGSLRILLVDDSELSSMIGRIMLTGAGHLVSVARGGQQALNELGGDRFDLVLLDLEMPEIDGYATVQMIREGKGGDASVEIPVVALTAHSIDSVRDKCIDSGMNGILSKPFAVVDLDKIIERVKNERAIVK